MLSQESMCSIYDLRAVSTAYVMFLLKNTKIFEVNIPKCQVLTELGVEIFFIQRRK